MEWLQYIIATYTVHALVNTLGSTNTIFPTLLGLRYSLLRQIIFLSNKIQPFAPSMKEILYCQRSCL